MSIFTFPRLHFRGLARIHAPTGNRNGLADLSTNTVYMDGKPFDRNHPPSEYHQYLQDLGSKFNTEGKLDPAGAFSMAKGWDFGGNGHFAIEAKIISAQRKLGEIDQQDPIVGRSVDMWGHHNEYLGTTLNRARIFDCDPASNWTSTIMVGQLTFGRQGSSQEVPNMLSAGVEGFQPARWQNFDYIQQLPEHCLNSEFSRSAVYQFTVAKDAEDFLWGQEVSPSPTVKLLREAMNRDDVLGLVVQFSLSNMSAPIKPDSPTFWDINGTIGLWCKDEMSSYPAGRLLSPPSQRRQQGETETRMLSNLSVEVTPQGVSLNMITAVPYVGRELNSEPGKTHGIGLKRDLGELQLCTVKSQQIVARIPPQAYQKANYQLTSGIIDVPLAQSWFDLKDVVEQEGLCLISKLPDGAQKLLVTEKEINLQIDDACLFLECRDRHNQKDYAREVEVRSFVRGKPAPVEAIYLRQFYNPRGLPQLRYEFEQNLDNDGKTFHFPSSKELNILEFKPGQEEAGGRGQGTGDRGQEAGDRGQETGGSRQQAAGRGQEAGDRGQEAGGSPKGFPTVKSEVRSQKSVLKDTAPHKVRGQKSVLKDTAPHKVRRQKSVLKDTAPHKVRSQEAGGRGQEAGVSWQEGELGDFSSSCILATNEEGRAWLTIRGNQSGTTRVLLSANPKELPVDGNHPDEAELNYDNDDLLNFWAGAGSFAVRVMSNDWHLNEIPTKDLDFDLIYREILAYYELCFSFMKAEVFSLADKCKVETYARLMWQMCDPNNKNKTYYMPPTRDMSQPKAMLLYRYLQNQQQVGYVPSSTPVVKQTQRTISSRTELVSALKQAAELEVAVMLQYIYAAYSIPNYVTGSEYVRRGLWTEEQLKLACGDGKESRDYGMRGVLLEISHEEMIHFLLVNNILMAMGEPFYAASPNFGNINQHFTLDIDLALEPLNASSIQRFISLEMPDFLEQDLADNRESDDPMTSRIHGYGSLSELYRQIREAITNIPDLFIAQKDNVGGEHHLFLRKDFNQNHPDYQLQVYDTDSALFAIDLITEQGEGCDPDSPKFAQSHYQQFCNMATALAKEQFTKDDQNYFIPWNPSYPVLRNPTLQYQDHNTNLVTVPETRMVMQICNESYFLMMQLMVQHFGLMPNASLRRSKLMNASIDIMVGMVRPLGELLMTMPSGKKGRTAGASFFMTTPPTYIPTPQLAYTAISHRFEKLYHQARGCKAINTTVTEMFDFYADFFAEMANH